MNLPDPRLRVRLPRGVLLRDPLLLSSGCWEFSELLRPGKADPRLIGGVVTKAVTPEARTGNPGIRIQQVGPGWMNSVGLKNPGLAKWSAEQLPRLLELGIGFFVNIAGHTLADFGMLVWSVEERLAELGAGDTAQQGVGMLGYELNLSCPNVEGGALFATDLNVLQEVVRQTRRRTERLLVAKLSPNVTDITVFAAAAELAGADAVTVANTYNGMAIDPATRQSRFARPTAGYSGEPVLPLTLYHIWRVHCALPELPIFGSGGITDTDSALQHLLAGASVLEIGSALLKQPQAPQGIQTGLSEYLDAWNLANIRDVVGRFAG